MEGTKFSSNPLIQSVVYKSFSHAIQAIGLPEFPQQVFFNEITPRLKSVGTPIPDDEQSLIKLWKSVLRGQIIATEIWNEEVLVFYVRGGFGGQAVDIRLTCNEGQWHVESVVAVYPRPLFHTPWFYRTASVGAVLVAAVLGYALHHPTSEVAQPVTQQTATALTTEPAGTKANGNNGAGHEASLPSRAEKPTPRTIKFTLSHGTSLFDLCKFLHSQHLVDDAVKFDMELKKSGADRKIRPGVYTFREGMSESQIIDVLKHGPSK